jgi:hypothetical protein
MNINDRILYIGIEPGWTPGKLYQWTGKYWVELDEIDHADKYIAALPDLLQNSPNGYFNNLFCMLCYC